MRFLAFATYCDVGGLYAICSIVDLSSGVLPYHLRFEGMVRVLRKGGMCVVSGVFDAVPLVTLSAIRKSGKRRWCWWDESLEGEVWTRYVWMEEGMRS